MREVESSNSRRANIQRWKRFVTASTSTQVAVLCCGDGHRKLITRFGVTRRV